MDLLVRGKYTISRRGSKNIKYEFGIASRLHPLERIYEFSSDFEDYLDFKRVPLLQIDKEPIYTKRDLNRNVICTMLPTESCETHY